MGRRSLFGLALLGMLVPGAAQAQSQLPARVMVLIDTSGSMGFYFTDPNGLKDPPQGDYPGGDGSTLYSDKNVTNRFAYPGKGTGGREGTKSRLFAAKDAFSKAINAYSGDIEFGLTTYDFQLCPFGTPLCQQCNITCKGPVCGYNCLYADNAFTTLIRTNWRAQGCTGPGGRVVVLPGSGSNQRALPWVDGVEVHKDSGDGNTLFGTTGTPVNPEIRAEGNTPLAEAIRTARTSWYDVAKPLDPQASCRPYSLVVLTDGAQSTGAPCGADPVQAVADLRASSPENPVSIYVIAVSIGAPVDKATMNQMADKGGTGSARFADKPQDIEAAFADIAASTVKFEVCNGADDTCNGLIDEGLGVYQSCSQNGECGSGVCSSGRCTCGSGAQCATGNACTGGLCVPSCSTGVGACKQTGVMKCGGGGGAACCADDGAGACSPLVAGQQSTEVCNGIDDDCDGLIDEDGVCQQCIPTPEICDGKDNDCDGVADNNLTDTGLPCGAPVGICTAGATACSGGKLSCTGGGEARTETCDGLDDNCDGVVDGMIQGCYTGAAGTKGVGVCLGGQQVCLAVIGSGVPVWGTCVGEITPQSELCNGLDDDCNGKIDDVVGGGGDCCPFKDAQGKDLCGVGVCASGKQQCTQGALLPQCVGAVGPTLELCDGKDNDCDGKVDDLAGGQVGESCCSSGLCGAGVCKAGVRGCSAKGLECQGEVTPAQEACDGLDNDCNGAIDDIPGLGLTCCPSGRCGKGICKAGTLFCSGLGLECKGSVEPTKEVCDGIDNDCNGAVDDVEGAGEPCCPVGSPTGSAPGACSKGICRPGTFVCQNNALVCAGGKGPEKELCDGTDNDCDGLIDEADDVAKSDPAIGVSCGVPKAPDNKAPCGAGKTVCQAGKPQCQGAIQPGKETCDGVDNDCDGQVDDGELCDIPKKCQQGSCVAPCATGEFPCAGGYACKNGFCVQDKAGAAGAAGAGASPGSGGSGNKGGSGGTGNKAGNSGAGANGSGAGANGSGAGANGSGAAGKASGGSNGAGGMSPGGAGGSTAAASGSGANAEDSGCGCETPGRPPAGSGALLALALTAVAARRRRDGGVR